MTDGRRLSGETFGFCDRSSREPSVRDEDDIERLLKLARALLSQARRREQFFPNIVFYDPQWLMVLDLFVATAEGRDLAISSVCIASGAANATAWRNIRLLEDRGLILRTPHPRDRRSQHLQLSADGRRQVCAYLRAFDENVVRQNDNVRSRNHLPSY